MSTLALRRPRPGIALVAAIGIAVASQVAGLLVAPGPQRLPAPPEDTRQPAVVAPDLAAGQPRVALAEIDAAIDRWSGNVRRDPADYISATNLGSLYATRARLTGNVDDYARAREAADRATGAASSYTPARVLTAMLLYATHDFAAAAALARSIHEQAPSQLQALATLGDSALELGDYAEARSTYATLSRVAPGAPVTARLARLAAILGDPETALATADRSVKEARAAGATGANLAWYSFLAGQLAFQGGDIAGAETRFEAALDDAPGWFSALNGLARVRAAQGRFEDAIALDRAAIAVVPQPEFLAELGDLYALTGRADQAAQQYTVVRAIADLASLQSQVYNRQLVIFRVNHAEHLTEAVAMAEAELAVRQDVYGYDALAWALLGAGRPVEATEAMQHALAEGTQDPLLFYHAGMIANALGDRPRATDFLTRALALNPGFDPLQAERARETLAELNR